MKHRIEVSRGVKIGAHHFPIKTGKGVSARLKEAAYYGRCYHTDNKILVDGSLNESKFSETVMHELIEAVSGVYCDSKVSHRSIAGLANGLTQALDSLGITFTHKRASK